MEDIFLSELKLEYRNGVVYFTNDDGVTVTVTYPWKKKGEHRYVAGKIEQADVY